MQRVSEELLRDKRLVVSLNQIELDQLATLAKWKFGGNDEKKSRKGECLLARLFVSAGIERMMAEMQAEMQANTTGTETA